MIRHFGTNQTITFCQSDEFSIFMYLYDSLLHLLALLEPKNVASRQKTRVNDGMVPPSLS